MSERDNLPAWKGRRGRYEVWFLTISDPGRGTGYWIRHTIRAPVSGPPEPRVWFAAFSRDDASSTFGINRGFASSSELSVSSDPFGVRIAESTFASGRVMGGIEGAGHAARWDLTFPTGEPTLRLLPEVMYRGALAPSRPSSPNPATPVSGEIEVDGERRLLEAAPGQQGHVEGSGHAERWAWASCSDLGEGVAFQALSAQGRRGPFLTPFLTSAALRWGNRWIRLHGLARRRQWGLGWWRLSLAGRRHRVEGEVRVEPGSMIRARYLDPDDAPRWCHNSEVASSSFTLWERRPGGWQQAAELASEGSTHAEWAGRTPAPGVEAAHQELP